MLVDNCRVSALHELVSLSADASLSLSNTVSSIKYKTIQSKCVLLLCILSVSLYVKHKIWNYNLQYGILLTCENMTGSDHALQL